VHARAHGSADLPLDGVDTAAAVRGLILTRWPGRFGRDRLADDVSLGGDGLGLDSIEIVELLLDCEEQLGSDAGETETLLESGPVTIGRLIDHLTR
jgi:acyl carrier protein